VPKTQKTSPAIPDRRFRERRSCTFCVKIFTMKTLRECINDAIEKKVAIGHFNISNMEAVWGIFRAAKKLNVPVIIGVSEGERAFFGVRQIAAVVKSIREEYNYPIYLNADHTYSFDKVKEAVDAGFDAFIFDGTELSHEENVKLTRQCVEYARKQKRGIVIEAELGFIGKSSKILDSIPEGVQISEEFLTKPEEAKRFAQETGVDLLAPAVGNIHGMLKGGKDPALNINRIREISEATGLPLVLHGGSGNSEEDFREAIKAGVRIVHINTEIRVAFRDALKQSVAEHPDEVAPYKIMAKSVEEIERVVEKKLRLFNNL
jgi:fructose-bisphosphate aldolase class II